MRSLVILSCLFLTSCASLGGSLVGSLVRPVISIENTTHNVQETRTVHEERTVHHHEYNIEVKGDTNKALAEVPSVGLNEKKVYFYPAP
jgi:hypothetical protein